MTISLSPRSGGAPTAPLPTNAARRAVTTAPPPVTVRPWWRDLTGVLTWSTMLFVVALWVYGGGVQQLNSFASAANSLGRLTGLVASDLLLIQVLRAWSASAVDAPGLLRAALDPAIGRALSAIHADPGHQWTIEELARHALSSRSGFAAKFQALAGATPAAY